MPRAYMPDLVVEAGEAPFVLADQLRLEAAVAIARDFDAHRALVGEDRLGARAVAVVALPVGLLLPGRVAQMLRSSLRSSPARSRPS